MTDVNSAGKEYAAFVMREMGLSPSALAKGAKLATTTLTRALNDPTHKFNLSTTTINKIAKFSGISPAPFFQAGDYAEMALSPLHREDMYLRAPMGRVRMSEEATPRNLTYVIGKAAAGIWRSPEIASSYDAQALWIAVPDFKESQVFALDMADDSAAPFIRDGEYALCRRPYEKNEELTHGDLVVVERWMNGVMELSVRRAVVPLEGRAYLKFDNARYSETIDIAQHDDDDVAYRVIGRVLYAVRDVSHPQMKQDVSKDFVDPFS